MEVISRMKTREKTRFLFCCSNQIQRGNDITPPTQTTQTHTFICFAVYHRRVFFISSPCSFVNTH